jgi:hypothetical protein
VVKQASSDRNQDSGVWQQYYNNDNKDGNNVERLKYNRDGVDDVHGFDNQQIRQAAYKVTITHVTCTLIQFIVQ